MGYDAVPSMDAATLLSSAKSHVNFINVVHYEAEVTNEVIQFNIKMYVVYAKIYSAFCGVRW